MTRLPIAIGLAIAIVAAGVAVVNVAPAQDVVYIDATTPKNVTLDGLPKAIVFNLTSGRTIIRMYMPGGVIVTVVGGYTIKDYWEQTINLGSPQEYVYYFNGTLALAGPRMSFRVVTPPEKVVIQIAR